MSYVMCAAGHPLGKWRPIRSLSPVSHSVGSEGLGGEGDSPCRSIRRYPHALLFDLISHLVYTKHRLLRGANCRKLHMKVSPSRTI